MVCKQLRLLSGLIVRQGVQSLPRLISKLVLALTAHLHPWALIAKAMIILHLIELPIKEVISVRVVITGRFDPFSLVVDDRRWAAILNTSSHATSCDLVTHCTRMQINAFQRLVTPSLLVLASIVVVMHRTDQVI